ncbi:TerD family protein [Clostridiaceae bacterium M8S5]|nr:TerD family protein [Clostridiaceae bacterium M8S5]
MAINLQKGQRINLSKEDASLSKIMVGLGWDPVKGGQGGGFIKSLFSSTPEIDCDASLFMLNANDKLESSKHVVYFGNLKSYDGSIVHMGDNLTGDGDGDDEQIMVNLKDVPSNVQKLVFVVNIYDCIKRRQHFGMIQNAFIRIVNMDNNKEMVRFNLTEQYSNMTALTVGELYRHDNEWKFVALGQGTGDTSLGEMARKYQ